MLGVAGCHVHSASPEAQHAATTGLVLPSPPTGPCDAAHEDQALAVARAAAASAFNGTALGKPTASFGARFSHPQLAGEPVSTPSYGWYVHFPVEAILGGDDAASNQLALHLMQGMPLSAAQPSPEPTAPAMVEGRIAEALPTERTPMLASSGVAGNPSMPYDRRPANARTVVSPLVQAQATGDPTAPVNVDQSSAEARAKPASQPSKQRTLDGQVQVFVSSDGTASIL